MKIGTITLENSAIKSNKAKHNVSYDHKFSSIHMQQKCGHIFPKKLIQ